MKKMRNINEYYLLGILPFFLALTGMSVMLAAALWLKIILLCIGIFAIVSLVKRVWSLPRKEKTYGQMTPISLNLPGDFCVKVFVCPMMDQYSFIKRTVEIISPLIRKPNTELKIAISPKRLNLDGPDFMRIAVMRELIRYDQATQVKAVLGLAVPMLMIVTVLEGYYALGWKQIYPIDMGYIRFFGPLVVAVMAIAVLLCWNKGISKADFRVDQELKQYFSKKEIETYIKRWDEIHMPDEPELVNQKSRELEQYYIKQRLERL